MSLILEGVTLPGFPMPRTNQLLERGETIALNEGIDNALKNWFENADWFAAINSNPVEYRAGKMNVMTKRFKGASWLCDVSPRELTPIVHHLNKIKQAVLLYNGEFDLADFKNVAQKVIAELPHATLLEILKTGGFPAWEDPEYVNALVGNHVTNTTF